MRVEVDSQVLRMFSKDGFKELFWEELALRRNDNPDISRKEVFDSLNDKFFDTFGVARYENYDSFRKRLNDKK